MGTVPLPWIAMSALSLAKTVVLSVLCVVVALFVLGMVSGAAGWIAPWIGLGDGGQPRLAWDLGWTILGGIAATAFAAAYSFAWLRLTCTSVIPTAARKSAALPVKIIFGAPDSARSTSISSQPACPPPGR